MKETKNLSVSDLSKRIPKGSSLNRKQMINEGTLDYEEGRKPTVSKNLGKYNRLSCFWVFKIIFDDWRKYYGYIVWCGYTYV